MTVIARERAKVLYIQYALLSHSHFLCSRSLLYLIFYIDIRSEAKTITISHSHLLSRFMSGSHRVSSFKTQLACISRINIPLKDVGWVICIRGKYL